MARILAVTSVALIAMSLCSVAYAQTVTVSPTVAPTVTPTVSPTVSPYGAGIPFYGGGYSISTPLPLPQYFDSARGNVAFTLPAYGGGIPSFDGIHSNRLSGPIPYLPASPLSYIPSNSARGNADIFDPRVFVRSRIPYNSAHGNADLGVPAYDALPIYEGVVPGGPFGGGYTGLLPLP